MCAEGLHDLPKGRRPKPIIILLVSGYKSPNQLVGQYKHSPVSYYGKPADIRIMTNTFVFIFTMFQWLVDNWERECVRFGYAIDKYSLVTIVRTLQYLYSVLLCWKITNKKWNLQIQIKVCELLIDFKGWYIYLQFVLKRVNASISTYLCVKINDKNKFNLKRNMNPTVKVIFARYCTYLLICCAIFSECKWICVKWTIINRNAKSCGLYICFSWFLTFWRGWK